MTNRIIARRFRLANFEEFHLQYNDYVRRRRAENFEDQLLLDSEETKYKNPNFVKEKDINFRLYPFYINWKKLEENEDGYYRVFVHFGYFGASIYSLFKEKYPILNKKNILYIFSNFIPNLILKNYTKEISTNDNIKNFFDKIPDLDIIYQLIHDKIVMYKEISAYLIVLKIYEIHYIINDNKEQMEKTLRCEFLLINYLTDAEYDEIYKEHFKGRISRMFNKLEDNRGKEYKFAKTKNEFLSHIKYIYKKIFKKENDFIKINF